MSTLAILWRLPTPIQEPFLLEAFAALHVVTAAAVFMITRAVLGSAHVAMPVRLSILGMLIIRQFLALDYRSDQRPPNHDGDGRFVGSVL